MIAIIGSCETGIPFAFVEVLVRYLFIQSLIRLVAHVIPGSTIQKPHTVELVLPIAGTLRIRCCDLPVWINAAAVNAHL